MCPATVLNKVKLQSPVQKIAFLFSSRTAPQSGHLYSVFCPWNLPSLSNSNWMLKSLSTMSFAANSVPFLLLNPTRGPTALLVSSSFISWWLSMRPATVCPILKAQASFLQVYPQGAISMGCPHLGQLMASVTVSRSNWQPYRACKSANSCFTYSTMPSRNSTGESLPFSTSESWYSHSPVISGDFTFSSINSMTSRPRAVLTR